MNRLLLATALAVGMCASSASAQRSERDPEVNAALERAYPGAQTEVTGMNNVNGVRVFDVNVTTKAGQSTARVTEHGDFLTYGEAQQSKGTAKMLSANAGGLFKTAPSDVALYRSTNYFVDIPAPAAKAAKGKQTKEAAGEKAPQEYGYRVRFDAVGRVLDIQNPDEVAAAWGQQSSERVTDEGLVKRITEKARPYVGDGEVTIFKAPEEGYYFVDAKGSIGTFATINEDGQLLSFQKQITGTDLPVPVRQTVEKLFTSASRSYKGEDAYFQFQQQAQTGNEVTVKMRPNGDILEVTNQEAAQEAKAAAEKQKGGAAPQKKSGA